MRVSSTFQLSVVTFVPQTRGSVKASSQMRTRPRRPGACSCEPAAVARAAWAFPVVGLLVGACSTAAGLAAAWLFGPPLHVIAAVAASAVVTGGLHLDGLADSADALFSWRSREKKLEILRDSRIGTMGAVALFLVLATKLGALHALGPYWWKAALLGPVWGRWSALYGIVAFPPARTDGLGAGVRAHLRAKHFIAATLFRQRPQRWFGSATHHAPLLPLIDGLPGTAVRLLSALPTPSGAARAFWSILPSIWRLAQGFGRRPKSRVPLRMQGGVRRDLRDHRCNRPGSFPGAASAPFRSRTPWCSAWGDLEARQHDGPQDTQ